ncbi:MAG: hypothetical protein WEA04_01040 [Candidatus Andersenbacteria bacterium]
MSKIDTQGLCREKQVTDHLPEVEILSNWIGRSMGTPEKFHSIEYKGLKVLSAVALNPQKSFPALEKDERVTFSFSTHPQQGIIILATLWWKGERAKADKPAILYWQEAMKSITEELLVTTDKVEPSPSWKLVTHHWLRCDLYNLVHLLKRYLPTPSSP